MSEPLLAEKEINEMKAKEHEIENLIMHLETEITYYDLEYCHNIDMPSFLQVTSALVRLFHQMKLDARTGKVQP